jgi:hypothetical protein
MEMRIVELGTASEVTQGMHSFDYDNGVNPSAGFIHTT